MYVNGTIRHKILGSTPTSGTTFFSRVVSAYCLIVSVKNTIVVLPYPLLTKKAESNFHRTPLQICFQSDYFMICSILLRKVEFFSSGSLKSSAPGPNALVIIFALE